MTSVATLDQHFALALERFAPARMALAADDTTVSFGELSALVGRLAAGLRGHGIGPGAVVGYSLPNCPEAIAILLALSRVGAAAVPLFPMMPGPVRAGIFAALGCSLVVSAGPTGAGLAEAAARMHAPFRVIELAALGAHAGDGAAGAGAGAGAGADQRLLAAASSGTTGAPKSVWMSQHNVAAALTAAADMARVGPWRDEPDFCTVAAFPLSTSGVLVTLGLLCAGVRVVFSRDLSPVRYVELAARHGVEALSAPPSYFETLLSMPPHLTERLGGARAVLTGMDFLSVSLLARLSQRLPALDRAVSGYGLVETSTVFMTWKAHERSALREPVHAFSLCPGVDNEIEVRDESGSRVADGQQGELWARGPSVVAGYLAPAPGAPPAFVDGWFRTGDIARQIPGQGLELCGRQKYLIKRGGKSVSPIEVQARLEACPGVLASAVVGVRQPLYGEMIWAFVVADRDRPATFKDVMKQCRATLPNYMVPDRLSFVAELPRGSGAGKLDREALIRLAEAELTSMQGETHG